MTSTSKIKFFVSAFLLMLFLFIPKESLALNILLNGTLNSNGNNWTAVNGDGFGAEGGTADALCATNSTTTNATNNTTWATDAFSVKLWRFTFTATANPPPSPRGYFYQDFTVPGTGNQLVRASSTISAISNTVSGTANTSWVRMDVATVGHPYVWNGILGCKTFNTSPTATTTIGLDRTVTLTGGSTYRFIITAKQLQAATNPTDDSINVDEIGLSMPTVGLSVAVVAGTANTSLSWTASTGSADAAALNNYQVYRGTSSGGETSLASAGTATSYTDTSATGNTTYYYWVTNIDTNGFESASSTEVSVLTIPDAPGTPTFSNTNGTSTIVSWSAPGTGATSYVLERCRGASCTNFIQIASGITTTSFVDTGLTGNTTYQYRVHGTNASGTGVASTPGSVTTTKSGTSRIAVPTNYLRINTGLKLYYTFDGKDTTQSITDSSYNGNTAYWFGGATTTVIGKIGQALSFNGTTNYVTTAAPDFSGTPTITISFWVNRRYGTGGCCVMFEDSTNFSSFVDTFTFFPDDTTDCTTPGFAMLLGISGNVGLNTSCYAQPSSNLWHHLVIIFDKTQTTSINVIKLYVDGVFQSANNQNNTAINSNNFGNRALYLMSRAGTSNFSNGSLDDFRIYTRGLTANEILQLYRAGSAKLGVSPASHISALDSSIRAYYTFDGRDMTKKIIDRSPSNNNAFFLPGSSGNVATTTTAGKLGQALTFDGVDDLATTTSDFLGTNAVSITAWMKMSTLGGGAAGRILGNNQTIFRLSAPNTLTFSSDGGATIANSASAAFATSTWVFVAVTRTSSGTANLYVNGALSGTANQSSGTPANGGYVVMGASPTGGNPFNGSLDDVRVYNRALAAGDITQLYRAGVARIKKP